MGATTHLPAAATLPGVGLVTGGASGEYTQQRELTRRANLLTWLQGSAVPWQFA